MTTPLTPTAVRRRNEAYLTIFVFAVFAGLCLFTGPW